MTKFYSTRNFPAGLRKKIRAYAYLVSIEEERQVTFSEALFKLAQLGHEQVSQRRFKGAQRHA